MISFAPTDEETAIQETAHRFARDQMRPLARDCEQRGGVNEDLVRTYWDTGLAHLGCAESCGGLALGCRAEVLVEEEMGWGDSGICAALPRPATVSSALESLGAPLVDRWLPPLLSDPVTRAEIAFVEGSASDSWGPTCFISDNGDTVEVNGIKGGVAGADRAEWVLVSCTVANGPALLVVHSSAAGYTSVPSAAQLGLRATPIAALHLDRVRVPREQLLGVGRLAATAISNALASSLLRWTGRLVGIARASYEHAARYATQRSAFGHPIAEHQAVAFLIADMAIRVEAARSLLWEAAWARDQGMDRAEELIRSAAGFATEAAVTTTTDAVQTLGGHGYVQDHPVEQWMRDARAAANILTAEAAFYRRVTSFNA